MDGIRLGHLEVNLTTNGPGETHRSGRANWLRAAVLGSDDAIVSTASLMIAGLSLVSLTALGAFGGYLGGAPVGRAALRVTLGGALAMAVTALIGRILGVSVE